MKNIRLFLSLFLIAAMLFSMIACNNTKPTNDSVSDTTDGESTDAATDETNADTTPTPETTLDINLSDIPAMASDATVTLKVTQSQASMEIPMNLSFQVESLDSWSFQFDTAMLDNETYVSGYFDGIYAYFAGNIAGDEQFLKVDLSSVIAELQSSFDSLNTSLDTIDEDDMQKITDFYNSIESSLKDFFSDKTTITEDGDGNICAFEITVTYEDCLELISIVLTAMEDVAPEQSEGFNLPTLAELQETMADFISDMSFHCLVNLENDQVISGTYDINLSIIGEDDEAAEIALTMEFDCTYDDVEVIVPENLDDYVLYDNFSDFEPDITSDLVDDVAALFNEEDMSRVENFDELYAELVETYGQESVDAAIAQIEAYRIYIDIQALYTENMTRVENFDELYADLVETYGQESVDAVIAEIEAMIAAFAGDAGEAA